MDVVSIYEIQSDSPADTPCGADRKLSAAEATLRAFIVTGP